MNNNLSLSLVILAHNNANTLASMIILGISAASDIVDDYEIIVTDGSDALLAEMSPKYECLHLLKYDQFLGYGTTLRLGLKAASNDIIVFIRWRKNAVSDCAECQSRLAHQRTNQRDLARIFGRTSL